MLKFTKEQIIAYRKEAFEIIEQINMCDCAIMNITCETYKAHWRDYRRQLVKKLNNLRIRDKYGFAIQDRGD